VNLSLQNSSRCSTNGTAHIAVVGKFKFSIFRLLTRALFLKNT
jgi:hypothetical protein